MPRPQRKYNDHEKHEITKAYKESKNVGEQKRLQCIKLRMEKGMSAKEIAEIIGYKEITVKLIISKYGRFGIQTLLWQKRQGNHRYLTEDDETKLLEPFLLDAEKGKMLIVTEIHKAYEKAVNGNVPSSTVYRMLERHGWRKIMPRSKHPNSKPEEFGAYKKNV